MCDRMELNVAEVIDAAATKPFGLMKFTPGPGLGGHCIPVDPFYLTWKAREFDLTTRFIELAGEVNTQMPRHVHDLVIRALNRQRKALNGAQCCCWAWPISRMWTTTASRRCSRSWSCWRPMAQQS